MLEERIEQPMGDLQRRTEDDGDILQTHLIHSLALDHPAHVDENVLDESPVGGWEAFVQQFRQTFGPSVGD